MRHVLSLTLALSTAAVLGATEARAQATAPPGGEFQKVSALVELPEFVPGLGVLYVDPATLPAGPFLAYDRDGTLVSTIYMIPLSLIEDRAGLERLDAADAPVDHVDLAYNAGHPGVAEPHYHVILWHVPPARAERLATK